MKAHIIFFDFDGVIVDSFSAAFSVAQMIHPLLTEEMYRKRFEGNVNESVDDDAIKKEYRPEINFFTEYEPLLLKAAIFPGIKDVLEVAAKNSKLIIVSSTTTDLIKKFLTLHGIDHYFAEILGNDVHKSKIAKIEMALDTYKVDAAHCVFITDTLGDIKEAHHVGVSAIAVSWGYQPRATLEQGNPSRIVETPQELLEVVR